MSRDRMERMEQSSHLLGNRGIKTGSSGVARGVQGERNEHSDGQRAEQVGTRLSPRQKQAFRILSPIIFQEPICETRMVLIGLTTATVVYIKRKQKQVHSSRPGRFFMLIVRDRKAKARREAESQIHAEDEHLPSYGSVLQEDKVRLILPDESKSSHAPESDRPKTK
jgi:hypothetical protein